MHLGQLVGINFNNWAVCLQFQCCAAFGGANQSPSSQYHPWAGPIYSPLRFAISATSFGAPFGPPGIYQLGSLRGSLGGADAVGVVTEAAYALVAANRSAMDKTLLFTIFVPCQAIASPDDLQLPNSFRQRFEAVHRYYEDTSSWLKPTRKGTR
jgi:hypothetical protein